MKPNPNCLTCNGTGEYMKGQPDGSANREECGCDELAVDVSNEDHIALSGEERELADAIERGEVTNTLEEIL